PADCQAHHIHPWWAGGPTKLSNLVLLCRHHHALIEPGRHPSPIQLTVTIAEDGIPEVARPGRPPERHQRFQAPVRPAHPPRVPLRT
ncbi:MAG: HNH endonuclease, partial [Propionibacteriaceae bacterium]|nr:HNH endonuclease [Propionibacteriaceae bacterium]